MLVTTWLPIPEDRNLHKIKSEKNIFLQKSVGRQISYSLGITVDSRSCVDEWEKKLLNSAQLRTGHSTIKHALI